jgi:competence protein ComEC
MAGLADLIRERTAPNTPAPSRPSVGWAADIAHRVRNTISRQIDHWPLWRPVAFGSGAALYFRPDEPYSTPLILGLCLGVLAATLLSVRLKHPRSVTLGLILFAFGLGGYLVADMRTKMVDAPVIPEHLGSVRVIGDVVDIRAASAERRRLLIVPVAIGDLADRALPARIRIVTSQEGEVGPGDRVTFSAILNPPAGPSSAGGYDFARDAFFERIGAVGAAVGPVMRIADADAAFADRIEMWINRWRWFLASRLTLDLHRWTSASDDAAGLAAAVTTSHEAWLSQSAEDALRGSGLAHMLAIAGLHTAAITGFVYWALRWGVGAGPALAVRASGKTIAATGGLITVVAYLALSGAHPPARRAAITAGIAFLAMILGRRAFSLHSLSIAALVVLALEPECVVQPGFQMSFCATGALIALSEARPHQKSPPKDVPFFMRAMQSLIDSLAGLAVVATVAGLATAPFAAQHFNQVTLYGTPANLLADFVASAILMPSIAAAVVGESFNIHHVAMAPVYWSIALSAEGVIGIGRLFSGLPSAQIRVSSAPDAALIISFLGLIFAILWKGRLRWVGVIASLAVFVWPRPPPPIGWINANGDNAAHVALGRAYAVRPDRHPFALESVAQHHGLTTAPSHAEETCGRDYCVDPPDVTPRFGLWFTRRHPGEAVLRKLCDTDILIIKAPITLSEANCPRPLVPSPELFRRYGAVEIFAQGRRWRLDWVGPHRGDRPWTRPPPNIY